MQWYGSSFIPDTMLPTVESVRVLLSLVESFGILGSRCMGLFGLVLQSVRTKLALIRRSLGVQLRQVLSISP